MNEAKKQLIKNEQDRKDAIRRSKAAEYRRQSLLRLKQDPEKYAEWLEKDRQRCRLRQIRIGEHIRARDRAAYAADPTRKIKAAKKYYHDKKESDPAFIKRKRQLAKCRYERDKADPDLWTRRISWRHKWKRAVFSDGKRLAEMREKKATYVRKKRRTDPMFRMAGYFRSRLGSMLKGEERHLSTLKMLGCSLEFLKRHLESKFDHKMNWKNYGSYWHVDHIVPLSAFDLSDPRQVALAMNWQNLQPLEAIANKSKNGKVTHPQLHLPLVV